MRQSKLPFVFGASVATFITLVWLTARLGVIQMDGARDIGFSLFVLLFCAALAALLWFRAFYTPVAARLEGETLILGSIELFPRTIKIPIASVRDARVTEKKVYGEPLSVLRLAVVDTPEIKSLRSKMRSFPYFGFDNQFFDSALSVRRSSAEDLAAEIQSHLIQTNDGEQDACESKIAKIVASQRYPGRMPRRKNESKNLVGRSNC